jgi:hypothetical protein
MRERDSAKDEWRKREQLRYGRKPDVEDGASLKFQVSRIGNAMTVFFAR